MRRTLVLGCSSERDGFSADTNIYAPDAAITPEKKTAVPRDFGVASARLSGWP
jgi:hypothetical protein